MKITLVHPTRGRPEQVLKTVSLWLDGIVPNPNHQIRYSLGLEEGEFELYRNTLEQLKRYPEFDYTLVHGPRLELSQIHEQDFQFPPDHEIPRYLTAGFKMNRAAHVHPDTDWYVSVADDTHPFERWNERLNPYFQEWRGTATVLAYPNEASRRMICHPICTAEFVRFNRHSLMHPEYAHTHADCDLYRWTEMTETLQVMREPDIQLLHHHPYFNSAIEWDPLYRLNNDRRMYEQGERVYMKRRAWFDELIQRGQVPKPNQITQNSLRLVGATVLGAEFQVD